MKLQYLGHSSFRIISEMGNTIVTDPFNGAMLGYNMPCVSCDVATVSHHHDDHDFTQGLKGQPAELDNEISCCADDIAIDSFWANHDDSNGSKRGKTLVFHFVVDGLHVVHMGDIGELNEQIAEKIVYCDVLLLPVGGTYTIDADGAKWYVEHVNPKIVVPMHYKCKGCKLDIAEVNNFTSKFDNVEHLGDTLTLEDLPENETTRIVVLDRYED